MQVSIGLEATICFHLSHAFDLEKVINTDNKSKKPGGVSCRPLSRLPKQTGLPELLRPEIWRDVGQGPWRHPAGLGVAEGPGPPSPCVGTWAQSHGLGTARLSPTEIRPNGAGDGKVAGVGLSLSLPSGTFQVLSETRPPPPPGQVASFQPRRPSHHRGRVGGGDARVQRGAGTLAWVTWVLQACEQPQSILLMHEDEWRSARLCREVFRVYFWSPDEVEGPVIE